MQFANCVPFIFVAIAIVPTSIRFVVYVHAVFSAKYSSVVWLTGTPVRESRVQIGISALPDPRSFVFPIGQRRPKIDLYRELDTVIELRDMLTN